MLYFPGIVPVECTETYVDSTIAAAGLRRIRSLLFYNRESPPLGGEDSKFEFCQRTFFSTSPPITVVLVAFLLLCTIVVSYSWIHIR